MKIDARRYILMFLLQMKCTCCPSHNIIAYMRCFGGGVYPLWFCEDHISDGKQMATKWNKEFSYIKQITFKAGDRTFKKYASAKW